MPGHEELSRDGRFCGDEVPENGLGGRHELFLEKGLLVLREGVQLVLEVDLERPVGLEELPSPPNVPGGVVRSHLRRFHVKKVVPLVDLRPLSQQRRYLLAVHALVAALAVAVVTVAPGNLGQGCQGGGTKKKDGKGTHFGARSLPGLG